MSEQRKAGDATSKTTLDRSTFDSAPVSQPDAGAKRHALVPRVGFSFAPEDLCLSCGERFDNPVHLAEEVFSAPVANAATPLQDAGAIDIDRLRHRLFNNRQVSSFDHSTACSIWGDDGQGHTAENFPEPLPCNCGALINFERSKNAALLKELEVARHVQDLLYQERVQYKTDLDHANKELEELRTAHELVKTEYLLTVNRCAELRKDKERLEKESQSLRRQANVASLVASYSWGTSVTESYHNERMYAMDKLREAVCNAAMNMEDRA